VSRPRGRPGTATSALVPAAARGDTALGDVEAILNHEAIEVFAKAVGGRDLLADTLAVAGTGTDIERITTLLLDPRYASWSLARLCQTAGITVAELFASYRKALVLRAHIEATHIIARKLPPVVDDVMTRAAPHRQVCPKCLGTAAAGQGPCALCQDSGYVQSEPELDRQKLALELGQLLEKKGGFLMQQTNVTATLGGTAPGSLEQLQQAVGDLLFGERRPQEVVPEAITLDPEDDDSDEDEEDEEEADDDQPALPFGDPPGRPAVRQDPPTDP